MIIVTKHKKAFNKARNIIFFSLAFCLFTITASAQNCTVNAGVATTLCQGQQIQMIGNIGGPTMAGTVNWSVVNQPAGANVVFSNPPVY